MKLIFDGFCHHDSGRTRVFQIFDRRWVRKRGRDEFLEFFDTCSVRTAFCSRKAEICSLSGLFSKKIWLVLGAGAVRKGSLSRSLFSHLIAPTGVVELFLVTVS